jgi:trans-2,3-dihydro-3-hydroxyanthranilate isomerase
MKLDFVTVDVFTDTQFAGNPLGVVLNAEGLTTQQMQAIAAEFNLAETTFVLPPKDSANTAEVRIFTPRYEMPFAGHPNVGTACVLARHGRDRDGVLRFEQKAGLVEIAVERDAAGAVIGAVIAAPQALSLGMEFPIDEIAACAGLSADEIVTEAHKPVHASVGVKFVLT